MIRAGISQSRVAVGCPGQSGAAVLRTVKIPHYLTDTCHFLRINPGILLKGYLC